MKWNKVFGGVIIILGVFFGLCAPFSYLDGYSDWWHFIINSTIITLGGIVIWRGFDNY